MRKSGSTTRRKTPVLGVTTEFTFLTEDDCFRLLRSLRWKDGVSCPRCHGDHIGRSLAHPLSTHPPAQRYLCLKCHYHFNDIAGTIFEKSKTPLWKWYAAIHLVLNTKGVAARRIAELLESSEKTTLQMVHRIKKDAVASQIAKHLESLRKHGAIRIKVTRRNVNISVIPQRLKLPPDMGLPDKQRPGIGLSQTSEPGQIAPIKAPEYNQITAFASGSKSNEAFVYRPHSPNFKGTFSFVLHSHLPYVRLAGRWPHGEEWIHEAISETYVPLLNVIHVLRSKHISSKLSINLTPILLEQLADSLIQGNFVSYVKDKISRCDIDVGRFKGTDVHRENLAAAYAQRYRDILYSFETLYSKDIIGAFRRLQDEGLVEIVASAATHGYLPLLSTDTSIRAQVKVGVDTYRRFFGKDPSSFWLPECAYRPEKDGRPPIEKFLEDEGIKAFFTESSALAGATVHPKGETRIGPYGYVIGSRGVRKERPPVNADDWTTYSAYHVNDSDVAVIARNARTSMQVWSAAHGYPGDYWYREFHKRDDVSGLQYWRVTGHVTDLGAKALYEPSRASERVNEHANHFASLVEELTKNYFGATGDKGMMTAAYDTELFGHWWFEGLDWLAHVIEKLSTSGSVRLATVNEALQIKPPETSIDLREGSWGSRGDHSTWNGFDANWMWPIIHSCEKRMESLAAAYPRAAGPTVQVLNQAARELLLLESSDWPFLVTTGQARDYAIDRFKIHLRRFQVLASALESGPVTGVTINQCKEWRELDNPFPQLDYRLFTPSAEPIVAKKGSSAG